MGQVRLAHQKNRRLPASSLRHRCGVSPGSGEGRFEPSLEAGVKDLIKGCVGTASVGVSLAIPHFTGTDRQASL